MHLDRCVPTADGRCALCADEALPMRVRSVNDTECTARVEREGAEYTVAIDLVDNVACGDTLLVHQGFAIARVNGTAA